MSYEQLKKTYDDAGQGQVFQFWDKLSEQEQAALLTQLANIDPTEVEWHAKNTIPNAAKGMQNPTSPIEGIPDEFSGSTLPDAPTSKFTGEWYDAGLKLIGDNKVAVVLMAGGQGTRLGSSAPKGCYDIGLPSHKSLFQLQAERIAKIQQLSGGVVPWYIMTSGPTRAPTEAFFQEHKYFGLDQKNVIFFEQGVFPCLTTEGKIILDAPGKVAVAPDGNGGLYLALYKSGVLDDMKKRGIEHIHTYCVDNCLARVADPVFMGFAATRGVDIATKVVRKRDATESVGLIVSRDDKPQVIEYSEISDALAKAEDPTAPGLLKLRAANIVNHYYSINFFNKIPEWFSKDNFEFRQQILPFHVANKKIPYVDADGNTVKPTSPNGIKLEQFVFDVFVTVPLTKFAVLEVARGDEFSPLKNAPGTGQDDPETSRAHLLEQGARWVQAAGATIEGEQLIEVSPLTSYGGEGLENFKGKTVKSEAEI